MTCTKRSKRRLSASLRITDSAITGHFCVVEEAASAFCELPIRCFLSFPRRWTFSGINAGFTVTRSSLGCQGSRKAPSSPEELSRRVQETNGPKTSPELNSFPAIKRRSLKTEEEQEEEPSPQSCQTILIGSLDDGVMAGSKFGAHRQTSDKKQPRRQHLTISLMILFVNRS